MTPLEVKESLCRTYDKLRHLPAAYQLMQPYLEDAVRHCGGTKEEYTPPMMRADFDLYGYWDKLKEEA